MAYEGSAFIVLFPDMCNVVSSHFLTVCTVQVSVLVFVTKRTRLSMEGQNLYVIFVCKDCKGHQKLDCTFSKENGI